MGFVLDAPLSEGPAMDLIPLDAQTPLGRELLSVAGVDRVELASATVWVSKTEAADWAMLKPAVALAIRQVLEETDSPLGAVGSDAAPSEDTALLRAVKELLDRQVNPSVAAHGGHISVEQVENGRVHLRMSGGCQGCAASSATLRQGVERMLRAALPEIAEIVDVTDHEAGQTPFYARDPGASAMLDRTIPPGVVEWSDGQVVVDPDYLAPRLGLTPQALRAGLQSGEVVGVTETGIGEKEGSARIVLRSATRAWAAELGPDGTAREVPPPREATAASQQERALAARVRAHLEALPEEAKPITYGALARALGLWAPGSVRKITRALEMTMQEDAQHGRPFIAARAISRGTGGLPGRGFFDLARALSRGPDANESDQAFHARELHRTTRRPADAGGVGTV
ncbi:DUF6522 family protein [Roseobacter sinensis]|uniref:DUF6522 family protein n=1 Tax=Roseobacter sinensis TaxID=2931391 RepID=A0ABT3BEN1_9RHOB|nr:DUF6522 family protein [Roseobacter sp. WL0113]